MSCSQPIHELSNLYEIIVHYLLIGEITSPCHQYKFPMVSALAFMVTHLIRPMMNHVIGYQIVMISPNYYVVGFEKILS